MPSLLLKCTFSQFHIHWEIVLDTSWIQSKADNKERFRDFDFQQNSDYAEFF